MPNVLKLFLLIFIGFSWSCAEKESAANNCSVCPIELQASSSGGINGSAQEQNFKPSAEVGLSIPKLKQFLAADIRLAGSYEYTERTVDSTYWHFVSTHPELDQYANLYRAAHCALIQLDLFCCN
ncbi:MAG: hypothetical protein AAF597_00765 [Bacteroidota bacterium]